MTIGYNVYIQHELVQFTRHYLRMGIWCNRFGVETSNADAVWSRLWPQKKKKKKKGWTVDSSYGWTWSLHSHIFINKIPLSMQQCAKSTCSKFIAFLNRRQLHLANSNTKTTWNDHWTEIGGRGLLFKPLCKIYTYSWKYISASMYRWDYLHIFQQFILQKVCSWSLYAHQCILVYLNKEHLHLLKDSNAQSWYISSIHFSFHTGISDLIPFAPFQVC